MAMPIPWGRVTPALAMQSPPSVSAQAMSVRAARSAPSSTAAGRTPGHDPHRLEGHQVGIGRAARIDVALEGVGQDVEAGRRR